MRNLLRGVFLALEKSGFARVQPNARSKLLIRHTEKRLVSKMGESTRLSF